MKYNKYIYIGLISLFFSSCNDVLDTKPHDKYSEDVIWSDKNLAQSFIYNSYADILKEYIYAPFETGDQYGAHSDNLTDNMVTVSTNYTSYNKDVLTPDKDCGWDKFALIREANVIIQKAQESTALGESDKKEMVAQGKMLRAMIYSKMVKMFGRYVIVDKVLTPKDNLLIPQTATIKDAYDFIIQDLKDASDDLNTTVVNGRLNKGAAFALLSEISLQAAAYAESDNQKYYEISKKACEDLFALNKYSLDGDYYKMFNDYTYASTSPEIIFALWRSQDVTQFKRTPTQGLYPNGEKNKIPDYAYPKYSDDFLGWGNTFPSQELVDEYEVIDTDNKAKKWNETSYYKNFKPGEDYVSKMMYYKRDARFYASIVYDSTYLGKNLVMTRINGSCHHDASLKGNKNQRTNTGYWTRKAVNDKDFVTGNGFTNYHHVLFRLGRVYLNYAEALLRTGDVTNAIKYINMTREKHGGLPALSTSLSKEEAWEAYKSERRVDLFMEGDRYWSLLRWYKADGKDMIPELNHGCKYYEISADGKSYEVKNLPYATNDYNNTRVWSKRKFLFPVPKKQIDLTEGLLTQNEEWTK